MAKLRRNYYGPYPAPITSLPFVADLKVSQRKRQRSHWVVPQHADYGESNAIGRQFAADFLEYIRCNPDTAGSNILGQIASDMHKQSLGTTDGVAVGFWSALERILLEAVKRVDHIAILQVVQDQYEVFLAQRALEEQEGYAE